MQRRCACGGTPGPTGECAECRKKRLASKRRSEDRVEPLAAERADISVRPAGHDFGRLRVLDDAGKPARLQPKLEISNPGDVYEREADLIADAMMAMPADARVPVRDGYPALVQRRCAEANGSAVREEPGLSADLTERIHGLKDGGQPLGTGERAFFEPRLGRDLGRVRIHADAPAAESARALDAHAYTTGHHIVFAAGRYAPQTTVGRRLLAHELVHVVQQGGGAPGVKIRRQTVGAPVQTGQAAGTPDLSGVPFEKWSEAIEAQYRRRGDTERANAVRACRTRGRPACAQILSVNEVHRLFELARSSGGNRAAIQAGLAGAAPLLSPSPIPRPPPFMPPITPPVTPPTPIAPPATIPTIPTTPVPGPAPGPGIGPAVTGAGVAVIIVVLVAAGTYLWEFGRFQAELRSRGYVILEDPLALCVGGCHLPSRPTSPSFPDFPSRPPLFETPLSTRLTPEDIERIERFLRESAPQTPPRPTPQPTPEPTPTPEETPAPERTPAPQTGPQVEPSERTRERSCATEHAEVPACSSLPEEYTFRSPQAALASLKQRYGNPSLRLVTDRPTTSGPCPGVGRHYGVKDNGTYIASIVCCPCCVDTPAGPVLQNRCRIV